MWWVISAGISMSARQFDELPQLVSRLSAKQCKVSFLSWHLNSISMSVGRDGELSDSWYFDSTVYLNICQSMCYIISVDISMLSHCLLTVCWIISAVVWFSTALCLTFNSGIVWLLCLFPTLILYFNSWILWLLCPFPVRCVKSGNFLLV